MTEAASRIEPLGTSASAIGAPAWPMPARQVLRAIGEARRGVAVMIEGEPGDGVWLALPAETASPDSLAECLALANRNAGQDATPLLLLAASRANWGRLGGAILPGADTISTVALPPAALTVESLRALADPTMLGGPTLAELRNASSAAAPAHGLPPGIGRAALRLAKLSRLLPAALVVRAGAMDEGAPDHRRLVAVTANDICAYPEASSEALAIAASARVPLEEAEDAQLVAFRPPDGGIEHLALLIGKPEQSASPLVRLHSECFTGDLLGSRRCDCGAQLHQAIRRMAAEGAGVLLYLAQEGRGIGLVNKLRAYRLQDQGLDTVDANQALGFDADERRFGVAARMLRLLGLSRIRLLTNNPDKIAGLRAHGIEVAGRVSHAIAANGENDKYLETKARRFGHLPG